MKRLTQITLVCVLMLAVASLAAAQGTLQVPSGAPQPSMRFGNFIEVGNDVLMHIIATTDFRYNTTTNFDFKRKVRDRVNSSNPRGTDIFGRGTSTENKGFFSVYCWLDYKFEGTPLRLRVGFDLWT